MNITEKKRVKAICVRIHRLIDDNGLSTSASTMRSGVEKGTVKALYEQKEFEKRTIAETTARKLDKGLDDCERSIGLVKRCNKCGNELPIGRFYANRRTGDGLDTICKECSKSHGKEKGVAKVNNNTETAMTAEIVRRVKNEDKKDVESKFMAPYFGITPKQLDEVRRGTWDRLLYEPKQPKRADSVLASVEALRSEVSELRSEVRKALVSMGVDL